MIKVYIASPYTLGDVAQNVKLQLDTVDELMNKNFAPFAPLYSHFQHMSHPRSYEDWLKIDFEWIKSCDCLLRLDGKSSGADSEVEHAKTLNIPVFYSVDELYQHYGITQKTIDIDKKHRFKKFSKIFNNLFYFIVGLIIAIAIIGLLKDVKSLGMLILYLIGWFRLTDLKDLDKK